jgi:hypothetical protein
MRSVVAEVLILKRPPEEGLEGRMAAPSILSFNLVL